MAAIIFPKYVAPSKKGKRINVAPGCAAYVSDRNGIWPAEVINSQQKQRQAGYDQGFKEGEAKGQASIADAEFEEPTPTRLIEDGIAIAQKLDPAQRNRFLSQLIVAIDEWTNESVEISENQMIYVKEHNLQVVNRRLDFQKLLDTSGRYELNP